jgi:transcriptional antiterminator RfaH
MKHWYALQSEFQQENLLWEQLCIRNIEAYYPRIIVHPVNPRSKKIKPYFPGYMFVNVDLEQVGGSTFQWMPGVAQIVSFGNEFTPIPDHLIQAIRERVNELNAAENRSLENFNPGDLVVVRAGTFAGYEAIFDSRLPGQDRVRVLLQLLENQIYRMVVPITQIAHKAALTS